MNTIDNLLKNEDYGKITDMVKIQKTLKSCIDMDKLVKETINIIDNSEKFKFRSERSKKFIDKNDPTFVLIRNDLDISKIDKNDIFKLNKLTDEVTRELSEDILVKIGDYIIECVIDREKFDSLFKNLPEEFSSTMLSNIYIIRLSLVDNTIVLKFFL